MTQKQNNDLVMIFKMISGELIIGMLSNDLPEEYSGRFIQIKNPARITHSGEGLILFKWNQFSQVNFVNLDPKNILYVDSPNEYIVKLFSKLLTTPKPKQTIEFEGEVHTLH